MDKQVLIVCFIFSTKLGIFANLDIKTSMFWLQISWRRQSRDQELINLNVAKRHAKREISCMHSARELDFVVGFTLNPAV